MDFLFYLAVINNVFSIFGLAGVLHSQKELVTSFFAYNAIQVMVAFGFFVDVCVDVQIRYSLLFCHQRHTQCCCSACTAAAPALLQPLVLLS